MNNLACAISKKELSIGEEVKVFVLTKPSQISFDSIDAESGYKSPFLYIDAVFEGEWSFSFPKNESNKNKIDCILDVMYDRASFMSNETKEFYSNFKNKQCSEQKIQEVFFDILRKNIKLEYDYLTFLEPFPSNRKLIKQADFMKEYGEENYLSLMVVRTNVFNIITKSRTLNEIVNKKEWNLKEKVDDIMGDKFFPFLESKNLNKLYEEVDEGEKSSEELDLVLKKIRVGMKDRVPNFIKEDHKVSEDPNFTSESYKFPFKKNANWAVSDFIQHNRFLSKLKELDLFLMPSYFPSLNLDTDDDNTVEWIADKKSIMNDINNS